MDPNSLADYDLENQLNADLENSMTHMSIMSRKLEQSEIIRHLRWVRWIEGTGHASFLIEQGRWEHERKNFINVVSYNVLSQILLVKNLRTQYARNNRESLKWEVRSQALLKEFMDFNADIFCFQEVDQQSLDSFYNPHFNEMGYMGVFKTIQTNDQVESCAIYFRADKFDLITSKLVEFHNENLRVADGDNIGVIVKLCIKGRFDYQFVVATAHLMYAPERTDVKLAQTQTMLDEIEHVAYCRFNFAQRRAEYVPVIFTGNMNYTPDHTIYQLLTRKNQRQRGKAGVLMAEKRSRPSKENKAITDREYASCLLNRVDGYVYQHSNGPLTHHLHYGSAYTHTKKNRPEVTTNVGGWRTLDYIFYDQLWDECLKMKFEGVLKLVSRFTLPTAEEAETFLRNLPNLGCGSDHLPLVATFHLTGPTAVNQ